MEAAASRADVRQQRAAGDRVFRPRRAEYHLAEGLVGVAPGGSQPFICLDLERNRLGAHTCNMHIACSICQALPELMSMIQEPFSILPSTGLLSWRLPWMRGHTMHTRKLGTGGLEVSALGLGCMGMSFSYGIAPPRQD